MPTIRYQIRNEYGLADPELYRVADNEDPEALLEGVAMAGLVGVLRQLGDLAEFAAEIFHDLHEEVTATAARGHELMLRVQQVEAEFPSIEKAFLTQTNHSQFAYNEGIDWHANLRADQNLVTQGDMPRFLLDSYEECRGPPRLFMLDKFDVAGAGACLKRYSDPSFFKVELASSGLMEEDVLRERKCRKIKKKGSRWRDGETAESFLVPLINSNLQPESSGHVSAKVPTRRVKLKSRNLLDSEITNRKSYMEQLLEPHSQDQKVWPENSISNSLFVKGSVASSGLTPEVPETVIEAIADSPIVGVGNHTVSLTEELESNKVKSADILGTIPMKMVTSESKNERESSYLSHKPEKSLLTLLDMKRPLSDAEGNKSQKIPALLANVDPKKSLASTEFTPKGDLDDCKSDGISSDLDNYLDALNTIESEFETDSESRERSELSFSKMRAHGMDSESCQPKQELSDQIPLDAVENSVTSKELNGTIEHSFSNSDISHDVADTQLQNHENGFDVPAGNNNVEEYAESVHVVRNGSSNVNELDVASIKSDVGDAYSGSFLSDSASSHVNSCTQGNDEAQSADPLQDDAIFDRVKGRLAVTEKLDCKMKELSDFYNVSSTLLDEFTLLSKTGDSSVETKDGGIYPAVRVEEQNSDTLGGSVITSDHLPTVKNESTFDVIATQNIEPIVDLTAKSEEEEQNLVEQDGEACFSGSVLPSIPEASPEFGTSVLRPKDLSYEESKHDISSSHQVAKDLDNMSALTEESCEFPSQAYSDMKFTEPSETSCESSDHLLPLSEIHGEVSSIANPKDTDTEISSHEVKNFLEVSSDLDGTLPFIGESSEFLSRVYNDMEFTRPMENAGCFEDLLTLSDIPEKDLTPDVELNLFEDSEDIQGKSSPEEVLVMHVEGSTPVSNVQLGALIESTEHDNKNSSSENLSPSHSSLSLQNSQFDTQPDDFAMDVGNNLAVHKGSDDDDMEEGKHLLPLAVPVEPECTSDQDKPRESEVLSPTKEESPDGIRPPFKSSTNDMGEVNILMDNAGSLELANVSDGKEPNESHDAYLARNLPSDVVFSDDMPFQNEEIVRMVTSDEEESKEARDADAEEHLSSCPVNEMFSDGSHMHEEQPGCVRISSHMHEEQPGCVRIDSISPVSDFSHEPIADASEFPNASKEEILQKEVLRLDEDTEFDDPSDEYVIVETDGDNQGTASIYSGKASGFDAHLQENYLRHNALLAEHDLDVNESSNSTTLNPQNESPSSSSAEVPSSELTILKSCNDSDVGLLDGACCSEPSKDPEPYIASENLIYQPGNIDSVSVEVMFTHIHSSIEAEISSGDDSEANVAFFDEEGEPSALSDQESEHLEASGTQPQRACVEENNITQSICKNIEDQPAQLEPFGYLSSGEGNELDAPLSNSGMDEKVKNDTSVASDFRSEISAASLSPSVSSAGLQLVENSSHMSETSIHETSELGPDPSSSSNLQVVDETPPLPPLPPVEWRIGKLRLGSVTTSGDPLQHQLVTSPFTELGAGDESYSQGLATTKVEKVQSAKHFSCLPVTENERFHYVSLMSEEEISHPSKLSEPRPVEDEVREESSQIVEGEIENRPAPFIAVSHTEDRKSSGYNTASVSAIDDETVRHPQLSQGGGQSAQHRGLQLNHLLRSLELERSQLEAFNVARNPVSSLNPFVVVSSPEEWKNQYDYRVYGHESGQHINMSAPFAATGPNLPPYGFLYPVGENPSNIYDFMIPSTEGEKKYRSIRDRPRDPLIEAVAAHDKSKLRKVSDLDRLPVRATTEERNSLLEQIKNKSFNLKPANSTKPNIKGVPGVPPTNLKIAAILEKANAIRQACVGSDEDEDGADSWSDS